jgi:hypothetical protein
MPQSEQTAVDRIGLAAPLAQQVEAHAAQAQHMEALRRALLETSEQDLALHRKTLETIRTMQRELERVQRVLRSLATTR